MGLNDIEIRIGVRDQTEQGFRDVNGRLRDMRGRFIREGELAGAGFALKIGKAASKVSGMLGDLTKGFAAIGSASNAAGAIAGVAVAGQQLLPIALVLPGALLAGAAAMGTFKVATAGFADALSGDAEAMATLAPAAQETVRAIDSLKPAFDDLRKAVQGEFFNGFAAQVKSVGGELLPVLKVGMLDVAEAMNAVVLNVGDAMKTPLFKGALAQIFANTGDMLWQMRTAARDALTGFVRLGAAGSDYLPRLGDAIDDVADRFNNWVGRGIDDGSIKRMIDGAIVGFGDLWDTVKNVGSSISSILRGLGGDMNTSVLANLSNMTAALADFLKTAEAQSALGALGETLRVIGSVTQDVVLTALRELAPIIVRLAPAVQEVARAMGDWITSALEIVGPLLQGLAGFLSDNSAALGVLVPLALTAVTAIKGFAILQSVAGWAAGASTALGGAGLAAALGKVAAVVGIGLIAKEIDDLNIAAAGGDPEKLEGMADSLHNMVGGFQQLASNPGSVFSEIGSEWDKLVRDFETGTSTIGMAWADFQREMSGFQLDPISFEVDTAPASEQVTHLMEQINGSATAVNINGNTNGAAFALQRILDEIAMGHGTVLINGNNMPAAEALTYVQGLINAGSGTVTINGMNVPAGQALTDILQRTNNSRGNINIGALTGSANSALQGLVNRWNGYTINIRTVVSSRIGGMAHGGISGGGLTLVGERGPEIVKGMANGGVTGSGMRLVGERGPELVGLPAGSTVVPNGTTNRLLQGIKSDRVVHGSVSDEVWKSLKAAGWRGRAGDGAEALYRPAGAPPASASGGGGVHVSFGGDVDSAFATAFMKLVRSGRIQIQSA